MNIPILTDLVIIFSLSLAVLLVCHRLRIPVTIGFILTGILAGPDVLGLVKAVHEVEILAEIGVILLLFVIGVEFSLADLLNIRRSVLVGGPLQVGGTCLAGWALAAYFGRSWGEAVFIGFLISLSSTAIVLKLLQERAEVDSPHGRTSLGILIFQDIIIVPMMLLVPLLSGESGNIGSSLLILLAKGVGIILMVIVSTKWVVPYVLFPDRPDQEPGDFPFVHRPYLYGRGLADGQRRTFPGLGGFFGRIDCLRNRIQPSGPGQYPSFSGYLFQFFFHFHRYAAECGISVEPSLDDFTPYPRGLDFKGPAGRDSRPDPALSLCALPS